MRAPRPSNEERYHCTKSCGSATEARTCRTCREVRALLTREKATTSHLLAPEQLTAATVAAGHHVTVEPPPEPIPTKVIPRAASPHPIGSPWPDLTAGQPHPSPKSKPDSAAEPCSRRSPASDSHQTSPSLSSGAQRPSGAPRPTPPLVRFWQEPPSFNQGPHCNRLDLSKGLHARTQGPSCKLKLYFSNSNQ